VELLGKYAVRAQVIRLADSAASPWRDLGEFQAYAPLAGTRIASYSSRAFISDDGRLATFYEDWQNDPSWTGKALTSPKYITRIRYVHRFSYSGDDPYHGPRLLGAVFEAANDSAFTQNVRTLYTIPDGEMLGYGLHEIVLDAPVVASAVRVRTTAANCCNFAEVEWIGAPILAAPTASVTSEADFRLTVSAAADDFAAFDRIDVLYARQPAGPFAVLREDIDRTQAFSGLDEVSAVGLPTYYCLAGTVGSSVLTGAVSACAIRPRQLERAASDQTKLIDGVTQLEFRLFVPEERWPAIRGNGSTRPFNGNVTDFPDYYYDSSYDWAPIPAVEGVQLAEAAHIVGLYSVMGNGSSPDRYRSMALYGADSVEDMQAEDYVKLAPRQEEFTVGVWRYFPSTDIVNTYRCVWAMGEDYYGWGGYVSELKFIGWTASDEVAAGVVQAPANLTATAVGQTVEITWTAAVNAEKLSIERRVQGESAWAALVEVADPTSLRYVDETTRGGRTYEYRVTAVGLSGMMSAAGPVVSAAVARQGLLFMIK